LALEFEWDQRKDRKNRKAHGVAFEDAKAAFWDPLSLTISDPTHSIGEERFVLLGLSRQGRLLYVVHRDLGDRIRIISARRATKKEMKDYEEKK
jgi:uncharacterized DUF497 family protein